MTTQDRWLFRIGVLAELVARSPTKLGRTALVKLAFLLQTFKGVPLGYNFRLYTYGPFDSDVLSDLSQAEILQAVVSTMIPFSGGGGYGYEFTPGPLGEQVRSLVADKIKPYQDALAWVIEKFGSQCAADLELLSTIVYADRDCQGRTPPFSLDELAQQVREIKPWFSTEYIKQSIDQLHEMGLLQALQGRPTSPSPD